MPVSKPKTPDRRRTRETALAVAEATDPINLNRLLTLQEQLEETIETMYAQARRRDEAVYELAAAGVTYADIARIIGVTKERVRALTARHLDIHVNDLNPKQTEVVNRH